jgi:hypothetical protein
VKIGCFPLFGLREKNEGKENGVGIFHPGHQRFSPNWRENGREKMGMSDIEVKRLLYLCSST